MQTGSRIIANYIISVFALQFAIVWVASFSGTKLSCLTNNVSLKFVKFLLELEMINGNVFVVEMHFLRINVNFVHIDNWIKLNTLTFEWKWKLVSTLWKWYSYRFEIICTAYQLHQYAFAWQTFEKSTQRISAWKDLTLFILCAINRYSCHSHSPVVHVYLSKGFEMSFSHRSIFKPNAVLYVKYVLH